MLKYYLYRVQYRRCAKLIRTKFDTHLKRNRVRLILTNGMFEELADNFVAAGWRVVSMTTDDERNKKVKPLLRYLYGSQPSVSFSDFKAFDLFNQVTFKKGLDTATLLIGGQLMISDSTLLSNELAFMHGLELPDYLIT